MEYAALKFLLITAVMACAEAVPIWHNDTDGRSYLVETEYKVNLKN